MKAKLSQSELARRWGLTRARVNQYAKSGMPLTSMEEAESWRAMHHPHSTRLLATVIDDDGEPDDGQPANLDSTAPDLPARPADADNSQLHRDDMTGTLNRIRKNEMVAWAMLARELKKLQEGKGAEASVSVRLKHYRDAAALRVSQEAEVDRILLQRRQMVTLADAKEIFGRHLMELKASLKPLPKRLAARCNPSDPELALSVLNEAIGRLFQTMHNSEDGDGDA